jgi:hypothetical protein
MGQTAKPSTVYLKALIILLISSIVAGLEVLNNGETLIKASGLNNKANISVLLPKNKPFRVEILNDHRDYGYVL